MAEKRLSSVANLSEEPKKPKLSVPTVHPNPPTLTYGSYAPSKLRETIEEHGFCVVTNVLTVERAEAYRNSLFDAYKTLYTLEKGFCGLDPRDPLTLDNGNAPPYKGSGMVAVDGAAGLKTLKEIRCDANVTRAFVDYYGVANANCLAKSNDRFGMMMPNKTRSTLEPHVDANVTRIERTVKEDVLQSIVVLQAASQPDQGLVIYPATAKNFAIWSGDVSAKDTDYYAIPDELFETLGRGYVINAPVGSMVLWRSTTPHGNTNGAGKKEKVGRVVAYVACYPWARMSDDAAKALEEAIVKNKTTGHNVLRPTFQKVGGTRFGLKLKWRFADEHLCHYNSRADLPPELRRPVSN